MQPEYYCIQATINNRKHVLALVSPVQRSKPLCQMTIGLRNLLFTDILESVLAVDENTRPI
jgi:hypothetical protein